ncbi:hypothetical protein [Streptomyces sp. NPDC050738]|uniref:hypothetical protein n=1 Tax=Streptomyces sp. NPDC050738 TaxID=3154744 RepID=UPI0034227F18
MRRNLAILLYGCVVAVVLVGGVWASWGTAQHVLLAKGRDHGTMTVASCGDDVCTGPYAPSGGSAPHARVSIDRSVAAKKGQRLPVVVKPGTDQAVRTGAAGVLHAWVPLGGALILAGLVIGGGLRFTRTAWGVGLAGAALLMATFIAL